MAHTIDLRKKTKVLVKTPEVSKKNEYLVMPKGKMALSDRFIRSERGDLVSVKTINQSAPNRNLEDPQISWLAPSFYYNPQKKYLSMTIIGLMAAGVGILVFQKDVLSAIFMMLTSLMFILYANKKPTIAEITVDTAGVSVADTRYFYRDLKSFWIDYTPGGPKELSIESSKWYLPYIKVSIEDKDPLEIRSLMISFLPEKEHENSLVDLIARRIGL